MFDVGDTVECINDNNPAQDEAGPFVIRGRKYTVSGLSLYIEVIRGEVHQTIFVAELPAPKGVGWYAFRFRKIEKTGTQIVDEMINKIKVSEKA